MRFKLDENLPYEATALLQANGHDAMSVIDQGMGGEPDDRVLNVCDAEERVLVTLDLDFGDIRTYPPAEHFGLVVLRLMRQDKLHVLEIVRRIVPLFEVEETRGRLWIVDEERVRIRGDE